MKRLLLFVLLVIFVSGCVGYIRGDYPVAPVPATIYRDRPCWNCSPNAIWLPGYGYRDVYPYGGYMYGPHIQYRSKHWNVWW